MNIDERVYGYEPATSQLAELRTEIERLRGDAHILRKAHSELCANNKHMSSQINTKNRIISDQHAEIERLHTEQNINDQLLKQVNELMEQIEQLEAWRANIGGQRIRDLEAEVERLRKELSEKDDYIRTVSRPIGAHSYE